MESLVALNDFIKGRAEDSRNSPNEGMLPPQPVPVSGRLSQFVEVWKRIMNNPYILSILAKGYRLHFSSPHLLCKTQWEIRSPHGPEEVQRMQEQISLMLQKNVITGVHPDSPVWYAKLREGGIM